MHSGSSVADRWTVSRGIMSPPNLPGWDNIPICQILQKYFSIPVNLCNDADACAVAEWKFGAGRRANNNAPENGDFTVLCLFSVGMMILL